MCPSDYTLYKSVGLDFSEAKRIYYESTNQITKMDRAKREGEEDNRSSISASEIAAAQHAENEWK